MSGPRACANAAKVPFSGNNDRPGGADALAMSRDVEVLQFAISTGNRQTRRLAQKNLDKMQRQSAPANGSEL